MTRTRSEYRLSHAAIQQGPDEFVRRPVLESDRIELAGLMLDAYGGTSVKSSHSARCV